MTRPTKPNLSVDLDDVEDEPPILPEPITVPVVKPIPITKFDLSSVKGYKKKRAMIKQQLQISESVAELKHAISIFDPEEIRLNHSLILFVSQIVEDIFTKKGLGEVKKMVVVEVCKEFFDDSPQLVHMVIDLIFDKIIKTSLFRRNKTRIKDIFFWVVKQFNGNCDVKFQPNFRTSFGH